MKIRLLCLLLILLSVVIFACACHPSNPSDSTDAPLSSSNDAIPPNVQQLYIDYLEKAKGDRKASVTDYCHFEEVEKIELISNSPLVLDYEIIGWQALSDHLWEVEAFIKSEDFPEGLYGVNYVGNIDGEYYVMIGRNQIPASLKEGVDIPPYELHGPNVIGQEDVIGTID